MKILIVIRGVKIKLRILTKIHAVDSAIKSLNKSYLGLWSSQRPPADVGDDFNSTVDNKLITRVNGRMNKASVARHSFPISEETFSELSARLTNHSAVNARRRTREGALAPTW